jgi:Secretion system C-terminal sorting domain
MMQSLPKRFLGFVLTGVSLVHAGVVAQGHTADMAHALHLIRANCYSLQEAIELAERIHAVGGRVGVIVSPGILLGWVPAENEVQVAGFPRVTTVTRLESVDSMILGISVAERSLRYLPACLIQSDQGVGRLNPMSNQPEYLDNAMMMPDHRARPLERGLDGNDPHYPHAEFANSEQMFGKVICSIFLVESDGSIDPNRYTWTNEAQSQVIARATYDLLMWSYQALLYGKELSFSLLIYPADSVVMQQPYEPILHPARDGDLWMSPIFTNLRYPPYDNTRINEYAYLTDLRREYGVDRAFHAFIVYNPQSEGAPWTFSDGVPGGGALGGPHLLLPSTRALDGSFGHEVGHIFYALDEYGSHSCNMIFNGVYNLNASVGQCGTRYPCFMREAAPRACPYTAAHVGWRNLGPAPTLLSPLDHAGVPPGEVTFQWTPNFADSITNTYLRITDSETGLSVYYEHSRRFEPERSYRESSRSLYLPPGTYKWSAVNGGLTWSEVSSAPRTLYVAESVPMPISHLAYGTFPNPSSGEATFFFETADRTTALVEVYTILGQRIAMISHASGYVGSQNVKFPTTGLVPGVYFYRIHSGKEVKNGKMIIVR